MSKMQKLGDLTAGAVGYFSADPNGDLFAGLHNLLLSALPISQGAADEVLKMLAGLLIGVLSKFLYGLLEKQSKRKKRKNDEDDFNPAPQPESLTINSKNDGNSETQISK